MGYLETPASPRSEHRDVAAVARSHGRGSRQGRASLRVKEEIEPEKLFLPKTVAAFANASGGFLLWGAQEGRGPDKGYLVGFPGIPRTKELALKVSNELQQISPLPLWDVAEVASPTTPGNVVVVIRADKSKRPPHILRNGVVYRRTPGGSSDPITDRAMLDRLVDEGREADRALRDRLAVVNRPFEMRGVQWRAAVASVPAPVGA